VLSLNLLCRRVGGAIANTGGGDRQGLDGGIFDDRGGEGIKVGLLNGFCKLLRTGCKLYC
jgi:hypothetical protein